jgi:hypothetical protein
MKSRFVFNVCISAGVMLLTGCATKGWTEEMLTQAKAKARSDFQAQNKALLTRFEARESENKELYTLLRALAKENKALHQNLEILRKKLVTLEALIIKTENKTVNDVEAFSKGNDRKLYKYIMSEEKKYIDELKAEMEKVAVADKNTVRLKEVIEKVLEAYNSTSKK